LETAFNRRLKPVLINLPSELVEKARKLGLYISKISENALIEYIHRLEKPYSKNNNFFSSGIGSPEEIRAYARIYHYPPSFS